MSPAPPLSPRLMQWQYGLRVPPLVMNAMAMDVVSRESGRKKEVMR